MSDWITLLQTLVTIVALIGSLVYLIIRLTIIFNNLVDEAQKHLHESSNQVMTFQDKVLNFVAEAIRKEK